MMETDPFNLPIDMTKQSLIVMDGIYPNTTSFSHSQPTSLCPSNQSQIMSGFLVSSMLQGSQIDDLYGGFDTENRTGIAGIQYSDVQLPRNDIPSRRNSIIDPSIGSSSPISDASLVTLLSSRASPHENQNGMARPADVPKTLEPNDCSDALHSSFGTSTSISYDGTLADMTVKWGFDKFLAPLELAEAVTGRTGYPPFHLTNNADPNGWISSENRRVSPSSPSGSYRFSNELSLSLATCQPPVICGIPVQDQFPEINCSGESDSFHERRFSDTEKMSCNSKNLSLSFASCKPVQFSQQISGSSFLHAMQEIFAELASYSVENLEQTSYPAGGFGAETNSGRSHTVTGSDYDYRSEVQIGPGLRRRESEAKKGHLLALLEMVDDRYNQCMDEIHTVISAFHAVADLDPQIHARFALQTMSFMYKNLRQRISSYILAMGTHFSGGGTGEEERLLESSSIQKQWALQQLRRKDQLWKPQRGLPERSVAILRAWMFQNFLHPYPKDAEKQLLAVKSGLTRSQVSNWFINARVRLWKPMIEEMYLEMNRRKGCWTDEESDSNSRNRISIDFQRFRMN